MRVGEFAIHADSNEISGPAGTVRLRPLIMQVLLRLVAARGAAVTREQLIDDVWSRKIVNDEVLSRAIAELRIALGDDSKVPRYIETLPKVGYRLVATVTRSATGQSGDESGAVPPISNEKGIPPAAVAVRRWPMFLAVAGALLASAAIYFWLAPGAAPAARDWVTQINAAAAFASDPAAELAPRFAPDGQSVIYVRRSAERSEVVIHETQTGERRVVVSDTGIITSPIFFPAGKRIAYWRRSAGGDEIVEHDLAGNTRRTLLDSAQHPLGRFDLAPDGSRLVFASQAKAEFPSALKVLDLGNGRVAALTQPQPGEGNVVLPRFSPDGARIAFFRGSESHQRVWIIESFPPYAAKAATGVEGLSYGLAWMGRDGPLVVAADWHGFRALNQLDLVSGETRLLGARGARHPDVGRDGDIVFESATYRADLWLTGAAEPGAKRQALWPSTRYTNQAEFSPDGKRVVFISNRDGAEGIFVGTLGADARRLPLPAGFRYIRPHWSPDGRHILAVRIAVTDSRPAQQQAVRIEVESGRHEVLTRAGDRVTAVHELAGGDLLIGEIVGYAMRLVRIAAGGSEQKRLALPLVSEFALTGNALVYTLPQLTGATGCELDTLRCTPLKIDLNDDNRFDWTLAKDAIWYLGQGPTGKRALLRHDLATGRTDHHDFAPSGAGTSLAASPDGKQLIVVQEAPPVIDLMLARKNKK